MSGRNTSNADVFIQVEPVAIIDRRLKTALEHAFDEIKPLLQRWGVQSPEEADWSKVRGVDFRESLHSRNEEQQKQRPLLNLLDLPHFDPAVSVYILD